MRSKEQATLLKIAWLLAPYKNPTLNFLVCFPNPHENFDFPEDLLPEEPEEIDPTC